jgi:hypothetical protein
MDSCCGGTSFQSSGQLESLSCDELSTQFSAESRLFMCRFHGILPMDLTANNVCPAWSILESGQFTRSV